VSEVLWCLGYPEQALQRGQEALACAYALPDRFPLAAALTHATTLHRLRGELPLTQQYADTLRTLATERGFSFYLAFNIALQGWLLTEQGKADEGVAHIRQGLAAHEAIGTGTLSSVSLPVLLADACNKAGRAEEGLAVVAEVLAGVPQEGSRHESELHRLKGELTLQKVHVAGSQLQIAHIQRSTPSFQAEAEAEACFLKAIEIARRQQAKSLELRAVMSLSRLWQRQGKKEEAHKLLDEIYSWFTEGFDTTDLREAKALLQELA